MAQQARLYTPAEAAAVSGLGLKAVNNVIDKHIVDVSRPTSHGPRSRRYLTHSHLLCMRLEHFLAGSLPVERRQSLFREVSTKPDMAMVRANSLLHVDVAEARREVDERIRDLEAAEAEIVVDAETLGGEPVFKGTRIPVYGVVTMLAAGVDRDELLSGYPRLDARKLDLALLWAAAHPRRGRPKRLADHGVRPTSSKRVTLKADPIGASATAHRR